MNQSSFWQKKTTLVLNPLNFQTVGENPYVSAVFIDRCVTVGTRPVTIVHYAANTVTPFYIFIWINNSVVLLHTDCHHLVTSLYVMVCTLHCRPGPGGRNCQKANVEHKACEGPPCPKGSPTFRDLQCLSYDRQTSKKKGNMLTAIINDGETH